MISPPQDYGGRGSRGGGKSVIFESLSPHLNPLPQGERKIKKVFYSRN
jgi:hypothetical protein